MHHLDMIQHSAARLCFNNYSKEPGVVTDMLNKIGVAISQRKTNSLSIINVSSDCLSYCWQGALSDLLLGPLLQASKPPE